MKRSVLALTLLAPMLAPAPGHAQVGAAANATLLARFDRSGTTYNDVWGYVAPNGDEYAILGTTRGTYILNCTDPTNPQQVGYFSGPSSTWRDFRTYRHYVYAVTEGGGGVQIIDMADPDNPQLIKTWGQSEFSHAHNVALDTATGTLYPCGTNNGMPIIDIATDPENPVVIGRYTSSYVHDLAVQDGLAHLGEISSDRYRILDVSDPSNPTVLGSTSISSCHNAWPSRDGQIAVVTSERSGGALTVVDISNNRLLIRIGSFRTGVSSTSIHNAYLVDRVCHSSYYSEGYQAVDVSDPSNPVRVAYYDTSSSTTGYSGSWGCYPFMPSGVIYMSDFQNGLHLIDSKASNDLYGTGTAGTAGQVPEVHTFGAAFAGNNNFRIDIEKAAPNSQVALLIGAKDSSVTVLSANILVDLGAPLLVANLQADANGDVSVSIPIGDLVPGAVFAQALVLDSGAAQGIAASRGLRFDVVLPAN